MDAIAGFHALHPFWLWLAVAAAFLAVEVATGTGWLLGQAQAQVFRHGFADQQAQLWNEAGQLLATTHQIVYYKS